MLLIADQALNAGLCSHVNTPNCLSICQWWSGSTKKNQTAFKTLHVFPPHCNLQLIFSHIFLFSRALTCRSLETKTKSGNFTAYAAKAYANAWYSMHSLLIAFVPPAGLEELRSHHVFALRSRRDNRSRIICEVFGYAHGTEVSERLLLTSLSTPGPMGHLLAQLNHSLSPQTHGPHLFKTLIHLFLSDGDYSSTDCWRSWNLRQYKQEQKTVPANAVWILF